MRTKTNESKESLFENVEDCQMALSLLMRKDAMEALRALDKNDATRMGAVFQRMADVLGERVPSKAKTLVVTQVNEDRHVDIYEAARIIGYSRHWLYRNAHSLPFTRVTKTGRLHFSAKGIQKWLAEQEGPVQN